MTAGIFAANAGHSNPKIKEAIQNQLDKNLIFAYQYITEIRQEFVEKLLDSSPDHFDKTILLNTGSEVTDAAYKLIKLWAKKNNKKYIVTFNGSYHGRVLGSALICGTKTATDWSSVADEDVVFIDFPTSPDTEFDPSLLPPADQIEAFFLETYQGWAAWMYPPQYIQGLYKFARDNGALVCFDEVQAGFYRMGEMYGYMTYGENIKPDLILFLGDSNSVCCAMQLKKEGFKIGHIEAGMRSGDKRMLEEINRTVCDHCSDYLFVYHDDYKENLRKENMDLRVLLTLQHE